MSHTKTLSSLNKRNEEEPIDLADVFAEHERRIFTYFRRMVGSRDLAADLAQETFVRALRSAHRFRGESSVQSWLFGIARNVFREELRRARRTSASTWTEPTSLDPPGDVAVDVERTLARLDPEHREVLVLRFALDMSGQEVAELLGVSHDIVRQRVARAKASFRQAWGE